MLDLIAWLVFWSCIWLYSYVLFGHGLVLIILNALFGKPVNSREITPTVCFIIPAYNEEKWILKKLENTTELDYPKDKLSIFVVSDASTDLTESTVKEFAKTHKNLTLIRLPTRCGRTQAINSVARQCQSEVVAISDSDVLMSNSTLKSCISRLADTQVGAVMARFSKFQKGKNPVEQGLCLYWKIEHFLHVQESAIDSIPFTGGHLTVVRRELLPQVPPSVQHDHYLPAYIKRKGFRTVYAPESSTFEYAAQTAYKEMTIRSRNLLLGMNFLKHYPENQGKKKFIFFSINILFRKILRWFSPLFLLGGIISASVLVPSFFPLMFTGLVILMLAGTTIILLVKKPPSWLSSFGFFCLSQLGLLVGIIKFIFGKRIVTWEPPR